MDFSFVGGLTITYRIFFQILPVYAWVLSGYSGFLPPSKNMHVRLIGDSKLTLGVSVCMCGCLSLCVPVMDWRPVQGVPRLSPDDRWDRLQPPLDPTDGLDGIENGWIFFQTAGLGPALAART